MVERSFVPGGIIVPLSTPLNEQYEFDREGMESLLEYVIKNGVQGVFVLGSCGEYPCFDDRESKEIVCFVVDHVRGRVPVFANASRNSTKHTLEVAHEFMVGGVDYLVLLSPFYFPNMQQKDIAQHFLTVAEKCPVVLYNLPAVTIPLEISTLEQLAANHPHILAMKDSSGDVGYFEQAAKRIPTFQGNDGLLLDSFKKSGVGGVVGTANIIPKAVVALYTLFRAGKLDEAEQLQREISEFMDVVYKSAKNAQVGVKQGLHYLGICHHFMRPPVAQIEEQEAEKINAFLKESSLLTEQLSNRYEL